LPVSTDKKFDALFAATFGRFPSSGELAECRNACIELLDAKEKIIEPSRLHSLSGRNDLYPLRIGMYEFKTYRRGWSSGPQLFYMDESGTFDIIEFWNRRARRMAHQGSPTFTRSEAHGFLPGIRRETASTQ
jgi:hypothetical protein